MSRRTVVIRADASATIGGGHIVRSGALASAFLDAGLAVTFATRAETFSVFPDLAATFAVVTLDGAPADEPEALRAAFAAGVDLLIVDHYKRERPFETACRGWARRIVAFDDLAERPHDCDALIDQTYGRDPGAYALFVPESCRVFAGADYAVLRPPFAAGRDAALEARRARKGSVARILVSLGAADNTTILETVVSAMTALGRTVAVDIVAGMEKPGDVGFAACKSAVADAHWHSHVDATVMAELMARADVAIGAAGSSAWERCCLGLPTLMVVLADNQRDIAKRLTDAGATQVLGDAAALTQGTLIDALSALGADPARLLAMARAAADICDGRGAERLVAALSPQT